MAYAKRPNNQVNTPLHRAALEAKQTCRFDTDCLRHLKSLVERGANVYATDSEGLTFLHYLLLNLDQQSNITPILFNDIARFLVGRGFADLFNVEDKYKETPFQLAAAYLEENSGPILDLLHNNQVEFNKFNVFGNSPLGDAVASGKKRKILAKLIEFGADLTPLDAMGSSLLHSAAFVGNLDAVRLFIEKGFPDVNGVCAHGNTPLHAALGMFSVYDSFNAPTMDRVYDIVELLVQAGANLTARNKKGETPYDVAKRNDVVPEKDMILRLLKF